MTLDQLDTPVRLTWDFPDQTDGQAEACLPVIAECIVDAGVFFATLQGRPLLHSAVGEVLKILGEVCQLMLVCRGSHAELVRLTDLSRSGFQLLLDTTGFVGLDGGIDKPALKKVVRTLREQACEPVLALTPLCDNLCNIPELVRFCNENQIARLKLPNAHIGGSFHEYSSANLPRWQDLDRFRQVWLDFIESPCRLPALEIHDLFLWEIMTPGQQQNRGEYGGCQAGNSLCHIDDRGVVHPCAAWPRPLGRLPDQSLEDIWAGRERLSVREHVARLPDGCRGCSDLDVCFGGCRGLALHLNRSEGERDLMCYGPR